MDIHEQLVEAFVSDALWHSDRIKAIMQHYKLDYRDKNLVEAFMKVAIGVKNRFLLETELKGVLPTNYITKDEVNFDFNKEVYDAVYPKLISQTSTPAQDMSKITRVEVIDHSPENTSKGKGARVFVTHNAKSVELSYQDDGRTLKIFVK